MSSLNLSLWIRSITGHNNLAYFQSKLDPLIDPTCRLCHLDNETVFHLLTNCDALYDQQRDILGNMTIGNGHTWSIKKIMTFLRSPTVNGLMSFNTSYAEREIIYQDHNYSSNSYSSL